MTDRRLRACLVTGVVVARDAISAIARQQADALGRTGTGGPPADVRVYCQHSEVDDPRVVVLPADPRALAADEFFRTADLIVFNFGITYPLFDALPAAPRTARVVAAYFGVTPPHLLPPEGREPILQSYRQLANLHAADRVLVTGGFVREDLERLGLPADRIRTVYPAVAVPPPAVRPARRPGGPLRLLYVGRFVPAKGVRGLLHAAAQAVAAGVDLRLDLCGSRRFSDPAYLGELEALMAGPLAGRAALHADLPDAELAAAYAAADAVVLPSRHEGFGVPVVEALAAGCPVLHADGSALPETAGGLGRSFPVGDVATLAGRLGELAAAVQRGAVPTDAGELPLTDWQERAAVRAAEFAPAAFEERFRAAVLDDLQPLRADAREQLTDAHRRASAPGGPPPLPPPPTGGPMPALPPPPPPAEPAQPQEPLRRTRFAVRRLRPAVHRIPVLGYLLRYAKRAVVMPWNFHKHYQQTAAFQADVLATLPGVAAAVRAEADRLATLAEQQAHQPASAAPPAVVEQLLQAQATLVKELAVGLAEVARLREAVLRAAPAEPTPKPRAASDRHVA